MSGLECRGLSRSFPGVRALRDVDLDVPFGRVIALLGENGAGKSTLARIISGVLAPDSGWMRLDGVPYAPRTPAEAIASGVAMIHQEGSLLPQLSVAENIFLGRLPIRRGIVDHSTLNARAADYLKLVGARIDPRRRVVELSVAARQQVEIAKALSQEARLLILDEPTSSLGADETGRLFEVIANLKQRGVGFVYISHRLDDIPHVADAVFVLRDGERVAEWDTAEVPVEHFIEAMVGRPVSAVFPEPPPAEEREILRVEGLERAGAFEGVSFGLRKGEILGIAGLVGAGRTELARALFGAEPAGRGRVLLEGKEVRLRSPRDAVAAGIVLVPEDRKEQGLVLDLDLAENLALPSLEDLREGPVVRPARRRTLARDVIQRLAIRGRAEQRARTLSGGNQQKAVVGKWLPKRPRVVILDEPTRGVDVGAKAAIYELICELAAQGTAVIMISSELQEVLGLAHRVLVMSRGRQTALLERSEAKEEIVMSKAVGR